MNKSAVQNLSSAYGWPEKNAIREGFENLHDGWHCGRLYESALCRAQADWLVGMNASRMFSIRCGQPLHVGRVQTPTLAMLAEWEQRISAFQKEKSYTVQLLFDGFEAQSGPISSWKEVEKMLKAC